MLLSSEIENWGLTDNTNMDTRTPIGIDYINRHLYQMDRIWYGQFKDYRLSTVFQPIYSLAHQRIVGYEALVRIRDAMNRFHDPTALFNGNLDVSSLTLLDRVSRMIHVKNFATTQDSLNWLFLNVSSQVVANGKRFGSYFKELLNVTGFPAHRVVLEIMEHPITNQELLQETVAYYKNLGCLIAIDDFGSGQSNFERIWSLNPTIVKLDRSMITRASAQTKIRTILPGIVSLLHQTGALVLIEGIETEEQAMIALECDADFVQGYFFAEPQPSLPETETAADLFCDLFSGYKKYALHKTGENVRLIDRYKTVFYKTINRLEMGMPIADACRDLFLDNSIIRAYQLRPDGIQIDETVQREDSELCQDIRFKPIQSARKADWFRRHYLQRAVFHPYQMQITSPYLSITGAHMCVTISLMFELDRENRVFCCDINWET